MIKRRALITGITGMDGSHLADFLLSKGYKVFGLERSTTNRNLTNIGHIVDEYTCIIGDLSDKDSLLHAIEISNPDEIYNLAAQSSVHTSFQEPLYTANITAIGVLRLLDAIREYEKPIRFYQASSSEMFGAPYQYSQNEETHFHPRSPYGVAKVYGHWTTKNYREAYGMFNVCGILFNHESERRGYNYVTRKITNGVAKIKLGLVDHLTLGNLDTKRDWGYSPDYVEAMWLMLQQETPNDYVIATGEVHSLKNLLDIAFNEAGIKNWESYIRQDEKYMRPSEVGCLRGDISKAKQILGWQPKTSFEELVKKMTRYDLKLLGDEY
jgi:GDPmannose 4,6-dehydratase